MGANLGRSLKGGALPYRFLKSPQTAYYGFKSGSQGLPWLTVPQGTQGTQNLGAGFLRHLRHLRHWLRVTNLHQPLSVTPVASES